MTKSVFNVAQNILNEIEKAESVSETIDFIINGLENNSANCILQIGYSDDGKNNQKCLSFGKDDISRAKELMELVRKWNDEDIANLKTQFENL